MASAPLPVEVVCFAEFEVNLRSRELRRSGAAVRLPDQSFRVLALLLEHPGELVTREEIGKRLWPEDTFVDFDHGLNNAVNRLREALGDSADSPRFIATLPRRGYRFIGTVNGQEQRVLTSESALGSRRSFEPREVSRRAPPNLRYAWVAVASAVILAASIGAMKFWTGRSARSVPIHSLAVLPLENLSGDPGQEYFADGMTDALITDLAKIGSLRVISRTSVTTYKTTRKPLAVIARELNVDAIVEGSVVRSGNRVRINAQLIQATPERHLWANAYERDLADVVALQGEVAQAIANEIQIKLTPREQAHLAANHPVNPEAYNAYLLGRFFSDRAGTDNLKKAIGYYDQAIQLDGNYALAWAGLADAHWMLSIGGHVPAEPEKQKARAAVERAIVLNPDLAEAHAVLGSIQAFLDWDWTAADTSFHRALALEPGNVSALRQAGLIAAVHGRLQESFQLNRRAVERAPLDPRTQRGFGHAATVAGLPDEALAAFNRSLQLNPEGSYVHKAIAYLYLAQSRPREALNEAEREPVPEERLVALAIAYHALGRKRESDAALADLKKKYADASAYQVAQAYAFRGESDHAFQWLERAYIQRDGALVGVGFDPLLKRLHGDTRFAAFLKKMHLPA